MNSSMVMTLALGCFAAFSGCGRSDGSSKRSDKDPSLVVSDASPTAGDTSATDADKNADDTRKKDDETGLGIDHLSVLSPGELSRKIYDTFGAGLTSFKQGAKDFDYLDVNADSFIGSISTDPNNKYASSFSIGYFLALAGLSKIVADNYVIKVYGHAAANDCTTPEGAEAIMLAVSPTIAGAELKEMTDLMHTACSADPASAVKAVIQSYSFVLKGSH